MIDEHQKYPEFIQQTGMHVALCPGGSLAKAATELLSSMDEDTCYDVAPLQEALENWELAKPVADIHAMFEKWYTAQFSRRGGVTAKEIPPEFFDRNEDGEYEYWFVRNYWPDFEAMVSLSHAHMSIDMRRDLELLRQQVASLQDPEMLASGAGKSAVDGRILFEKWFSDFILRSSPPEGFFVRRQDGCYARSVVEGNWVAFSAALSFAKHENNAVAAQQAEIARLRAVLAEETQRADTAQQELESARAWIKHGESLLGDIRPLVDGDFQAEIDNLVKGPPA
jgi:hypothetical protein